MCEICLQYPCPPRCPNASESPRVFVCSGCGDDILEGDDYWEFFGEQFCEKCNDDSKKVAVYDPY